MTVTVSPSKLTIEPGHKATYKVTFTRTTAAYRRYVTGALTWTDGTHSVRSQLAIRPVDL
jgi:hypothetical protein